MPQESKTSTGLIVGGVVLVVVVIAIGVWFMQQRDETMSDDTMAPQEAEGVMMDDTPSTDAMMDTGEIKSDDAMMQDSSSDTMIKKDEPADVMMDGGQGQSATGVTVTVAAAPQYIDYSPAAFAAAAGATHRVLFFHATWCPFCKEANADFTAHLSQLPAGTVLLKTDYDREVELKKKYGITYQHTFVVVDAAGNELAKWNGGGVAEMNTHLAAL